MPDSPVGLREVAPLPEVSRAPAAAGRSAAPRLQGAGSRRHAAAQVAQKQLVGFQGADEGGAGAVQGKRAIPGGRRLRGVRSTQRKATASFFVNFPPPSFGKRGDKGGVEAPCVPFHPPGCGLRPERRAGGGALQVPGATSTRLAAVGLSHPEV